MLELFNNIYSLFFNFVNEVLSFEIIPGLTAWGLLIVIVVFVSLALIVSRVGGSK